MPLLAFSKASFFYDGEFGIKYDLARIKQTVNDTTTFKNFNSLEFQEGFSFGLACSDSILLSIGASFIEDGLSSKNMYLSLSQRFFILGKFSFKAYIAKNFLLNLAFLYGALLFYKNSYYAQAIGTSCNLGYVIFENKEKNIRVIPSLQFSFLRSNFSDDFSIGAFITLERRAK